MASPLQTVGNDVPEINVVWLCGRQGDQTLRALVLMGCAKHGGKEASAGWMLMSSPVSERVVRIVYFLSIEWEQGLRLGDTGDWKDRQGSAHSYTWSQLPGSPYPRCLEDSVWFQARRPAPETAIVAPTEGQGHFPQSHDPR